jgi:hypothetical protein
MVVEVIVVLALLPVPLPTREELSKVVRVSNYSREKLVRFYY